jgi:hypothetical protein
VPFAEFLFRKIRFAVEDLSPCHNRFVEGQMLKGVQRVVMDENVDRPLGRQHVARMLNRALQQDQPQLNVVLRNSTGTVGSVGQRHRAHGSVVMAGRATATQVNIRLRRRWEAP